MANLLAAQSCCRVDKCCPLSPMIGRSNRSEEHTSELQSLMRHPYAAFCLKKKTERLPRSTITGLRMTPDPPPWKKSITRIRTARRRNSQTYIHITLKADQRPPTATSLKLTDTRRTHAHTSPNTAPG